MKKILVLNTKHNKLYFDVSTEELKYNVADFIIKKIYLKSGYYKDIENMPIEPSKVEIPDNFLSLPNEIQKSWTKLQENSKYELINFKHNLFQHKLLQECLNGNKKSAWTLINIRSNREYEYETFTVDDIVELGDN